MPRDHHVATALVDALPVAEEVALLGVLPMKVPELVGRLGAELHVAQHAIDEQTPEAFFLGQRARRA